ncbi:MAG: hypothetical protein IT290_05910 [Deltaproteobacteria bacterium]|nr:hypothetical protein [Deltaproteobacteria bacterium]
MCPVIVGSRAVAQSTEKKPESSAAESAAPSIAPAAPPSRPVAPGECSKDFSRLFNSSSDQCSLASLGNSMLEGFKIGLRSSAAELRQSAGQVAGGDPTPMLAAGIGIGSVVIGRPGLAPRLESIVANGPGAGAVAPIFAEGMRRATSAAPAQATELVKDTAMFLQRLGGKVPDVYGADTLRKIVPQSVQQNRDAVLELMREYAPDLAKRVAAIPTSTKDLFWNAVGRAQ